MFTRFVRCTRYLRYLGIAFAVASPGLQAAPVTLRFHAMVGSVDTYGSGANLPFNLTPGDLFSGTLSFESNVNGPVYPMAALLRLTIDGVELAAEDLDVRVENDVAGGVDFRGRIADPYNTPDAELGGSSDNFFVYYSGLKDSGVAIPNGNPRFRPYLAFSNDETLLSSGALTGDPEVWGGFSFREMSLTFYDEPEGLGTYVGAYIGDVTAVPEPYSGKLAALALALLAFGYQKKMNASATRDFIGKDSWN